MATDFDVSIDGNLPHVENGDRLNVYTDVRNITDGELSDTLELVIGGAVVDSRDITLGRDDVDEFILAWGVENISTPETRTVEVRTTNDSSGTRTLVLRPYDDTIRARFDPAGSPAEVSYVESADDVGPNT